jgi:translation initiation factor 3 subunit M
MLTSNQVNRMFCISWSYVCHSCSICREKAYEYSLSYVRSLPSTSSAAQEAAVEVIATAIRLPLVFDFDPLFKLDAVVAVKNNELFSLLQIFLNDGLSEFKAWEDIHPGAIEKHSKLSALNL